MEASCFIQCIITGKRIKLVYCDESKKLALTQFPISYSLILRVCIEQGGSDGVYVKFEFKRLWISKFNSCRLKYSKTCVKRPLSKIPKIDLQDQLSLNAGPKYCRMLQAEHSAILSTFIKLPFIIKIFVLSIFEWPFYTGFTVYFKCQF